MAEFEKSIVSFLINQSTLTNLIGNRLYPNIAKQNVSVFPFVVYDIISDNEKKSSIRGNYGLFNDIYQFSVYGQTRTSVKNIEIVLKALFKNKSDSNFDNLFDLQWTEKINIYTSYNNDDYWAKLEYGFFYSEL